MRELERVGEQIFDDLLKKRNRRLLDEIQTRLSESENIIVRISWTPLLPLSWVPPQRARVAYV